MKTLEDRVAVVTGGASGIGRGIAIALAEAGCHVVIADVEEAPARETAREVEAIGVRALAVSADVSDRRAVEALADRAWAELGAVHVLCNNAGVGAGGMLAETTDDDWRWVVDVNLVGVVNGLQAFLPRMKEQPGEKHVVNTASMAGLVASPGLGPYSATKFAVVGLTEALRIEGAAYDLGASVLCPGLVRTRILESSRNRPAGRLSATPVAGPLVQGFAEMLERDGLDPVGVGRTVREAILRNDLYVLTHPDLWPHVAARFDAIRAAFESAAERARS